MLTIHRRSVNSRELLKVVVEQARAETVVDITTLPVQMAVVEEGIHPDTGDYVPADWETISGKTYATALIGPGGGIQLALTDEFYIAWVKVNTGIEFIELKAVEDVIEVY
jgi:hypothetical protein